MKCHLCGEALDILLKEAQKETDQPIGAIGYGLNEEQQKIVCELQEWQQQSLKSKVVLGGPLGEKNE
jgi:hypothetical protein